MLFVTKHREQGGLWELLLPNIAEYKKEAGLCTLATVQKKD
jgi:hypothetical protein